MIDPIDSTYADLVKRLGIDPDDPAKPVFNTTPISNGSFPFKLPDLADLKRQVERQVEAIKERSWVRDARGKRIDDIVQIFQGTIEQFVTAMVANGVEIRKTSDVHTPVTFTTPIGVMEVHPRPNLGLVFIGTREAIQKMLGVGRRSMPFGGLGNDMIVLDELGKAGNDKSEKTLSGTTH